MEPVITLTELLDARENRAGRIAALLRLYPHCSLLSLTVNMPGPVKRTQAADRVFRSGCRALIQALNQAGLSPVFSETAELKTGCEARFLVQAHPRTLKTCACQLENSLPWGRLLDVDVPEEGGRPLSRTALGLPERGCMVCGKPGAYCASRRAHPLPEILAAFDRLAALAPEEEP